MPTYVVTGNIYLTQEYGYVYQIEADTPEEASEKFQELITSRNFPLDLEIYQVDRAHNQGGTYHVFANKVDSEDESNALTLWGNIRSRLVPRPLRSADKE